ncbi:hypothetical protein Lalb_Chr05g0223861 [Lupinus albus]|uniref:Transmembrane protein n=1 Tax=Lupinus albus TaxID=3870 RepID=A0A6A4QKV9_LUPAL|nr:hypothetical protein Lalb_Chr05g0223861 [Lupinus albus]
MNEWSKKELVLLNLFCFVHLGLGLGLVLLCVLLPLTNPTPSTLFSLYISICIYLVHHLLMGKVRVVLLTFLLCLKFDNILSFNPYISWQDPIILPTSLLFTLCEVLKHL